MRVLTGFERKIRERLRALSSYDAVVLFSLLAFTALFLVYPMRDLPVDAGRQGLSGIFWHDVIRNVVLTGRFDSLQEFVATYLKQYESDFFYYPVFWGLILGSSFLFFGISEVTFYSTVLIFALASILATYLLASRLYDSRAGVIASLFLASSHALFAYTKGGEVDVPPTALVALSMLAFLKAEADKRWTYSVLAGILFGLSFMMKPTTAIAVVAIALYLVLKYFRARDMNIGNLVISNRFKKQNIQMGLRNFIIIIIPASILILIQIYIWAGSGEISSWLNAVSGPPVFPSFSWYVCFSWIFTQYLSPIVVALFMIGFVLCVSRRKNEDVFLLTWFATFVLFAVTASNRLPRYLLPLVPCLSIIAAQGLVSLYDMAKQKLKIRRGKIPVRNLIKTLCIFLIILGILNGVVLIQRESYENIDDSPVDEVAKFLVEKAGVICILPNPCPYSVPTLEFHILKYDRQNATHVLASLSIIAQLYSIFSGLIVSEELANETFLASLDWLSDNYGGKTVYLVVPNLDYWIQEHPEFGILTFLEEYLKPFQKIYSYMESHGELIPLIGVFRRGGLEIRVYQRIKGAF